MKEGNNTSKIVVAVISVLGFLGLLVLGKKSLEKNVKIEKDSEEKNINTKEEPQAPDIQDKTDVVNIEPDVESSERNKEALPIFEDYEDLITYSIKSVLKNADFCDQSDFMGKVITLASILCDNDEWFNYFPKNIDELKEILERNNLLQEYNIRIYKKYV